MKIGILEYWGKAQIHTGSCKLRRSAEKAKRYIHTKTTLLDGQLI